MKSRINILLVGLLLSTGSQAQVAACLEEFNDPLGDWVNKWLYQNTNMQNYYVAGGNCDDNDRGNQPDGLWVSDDKACGSLVQTSPVTININPELGDNATSFSLDAYTCGRVATLNIYDKDGGLEDSTVVADACFSFANNYSFDLANGISAFEFVGPSIEGNTGIDNVMIAGPIDCGVTGIPQPEPAAPVPTLNEWALLLLAGLLGTLAWGALRRRNTVVR